MVLIDIWRKMENFIQEKRLEKFIGQERIKSCCITETNCDTNHVGQFFTIIPKSGMKNCCIMSLHLGKIHASHQTFHLSDVLLTNLGKSSVEKQLAENYPAENSSQE